MDIQALTQTTDPTQISDTSSTKPAANPSIDGLANENTFLQLLVAQIKNQDPLQPADSIQFLSQLAQFSQLEQLIGIRQDLQHLAQRALRVRAAAGGAQDARQRQARSLVARILLNRGRERLDALVVLRIRPVDEAQDALRFGRIAQAVEALERRASFGGASLPERRDRLRHGRRS